MTAANADFESAPRAAMAAFLRGLERRAAVFAELQSGDASAGDGAVAVTMLHWHTQASGLAMGDWPVRFWSTLLAQPQMRARTPVALCLQPSDRLGELACEPRAALLLRLAAGLEERTAAAALGVSESAYLLTLQQAVPRQSDGSQDLQGWRRLGEEIQRRIRTLPPSRLLRLSSAREAALLSPSAPPPAAGPAGDGRSMPRLLIVLWALLVACALALAATFLPAAGGWLDRYAGASRPAGELPQAPAASYYTPAAGLVAHPDFALLADPGASAAMDLDFHSWLASQPTEHMGGTQPLITTSEPESPDEAPGSDASQSAARESDDAQI